MLQCSAMTSLMHKLCLFILTLAIKISSARKFECGEHGRFEYCIDEIPGCVVGCDCDPGYYFDADSKICEPNSKLWSRRRLSSSDRKRKQKNKKSKQSRHVRDSEERIVEGFGKVADHASELSDWISNTFFSEIEKQAEKQSKTKYVTKKPKKQRKGTHRIQKNRPKVRDANNKKIYFKATSAERRPIRRSGDGKVDESKNKDRSMEKEIGYRSTSEEYGDENAWDKEIDPGFGEETEEDSESGDEDHEKHDHRHVLVVKKPKPKRANPIPAMPVMPSFIFLPSLDTPFYPPAPLGLPAPPVVPMYPSVPVPPVPPAYPVPDPQAYTKIQKTTTHPATTTTLEEGPTTKTTLKPIKTTSLSTTTETKSTTQSTSTSDIISTKTKLDSTTISTLQTTITTTPLNSSTTFTTETVNSSNSRKAHDMNEDYEYLEDRNSSQLLNRRKEFTNQRMKTIRLSDRILKNSDFKNNSLRRAHNNSKELLILNVINVPSHALKSALYQKINYKSMPEMNDVNKYISDRIQRPEFNDHIKYLDLHPQNNIIKYSTARFHERGDDFIKDLQIVNYTNLEKQIVSSLLSETNVIISSTTPLNNAGYLKKSKDLLLNLENQVIRNTPEDTFSMGGPIQTRHNVVGTLQDNKMTPNIVNALNNKNVHQLQEKRYDLDNIIPYERIVDKHNIRNGEDNINKILFWDSSNVELYKTYKNNQVINSKDPKPKQFLRHQQLNSKGTKNAVLLNQNPLGMNTLVATTRQPERSYIGRTFFSGDIM